MQQPPTYLPHNNPSQTKPIPQSGHRDYLDGLRALAALWVVLSHLWISQFGMAAHAGWLGLATNWTLYSHFAVDIFIVLSGFCLVLPVIRDGGLNGGARAFFVRRAWRILPPFYAALILSVMLSFGLQALAHQPLMVNGWALLVNLMLLQDLYLPLNIYNGPFWSIAVEWRIYFLFPVLIWLLVQRGKRIVLVSAALLGGVLTLILIHWHPEMLLACPWYLFLFALGVCAGAATRSSAVRSPAFSLLCLLLAGCGCIVLFFLLHAHPITLKNGVDFGSYLPVFDCILGSVVTLLLLVLTPNPQRAPFLAWKPLVRLGTFAYSLYLIHMPCLLLFSRLLTIWRPTLTDPLARVLLLSCTLPLIVSMAYLFFLAFERPFLRRRAANFEVKSGMLSKVIAFADNTHNTKQIRRETETNA